MSCCWAEGIVLGRERRDFIPPHLFGESVSRDGDELVTRQMLRRDRRRAPVLTKWGKKSQLAARNTLASKATKQGKKSCSARLELSGIDCTSSYTIATAALPLLAPVISEVPKL